MVKNFTNMKKQGTITSHLRSLNIKKTRIYGVGNLCPGMGRALKYDGVIPVRTKRKLPTCHESLTNFIT
jgi:hypothetical protein